MSITLRDYQTGAVEDVRKAFHEGIRSVIVCLPTGAGKTPFVAHGIIKSAVAKSNRVLFLAHTQELIRQGAAHIERACGPVTGIIMAGNKEQRQKPVQVASIQTLARRALPKARIVIVDECHHVRSATYSRVISHYREQGALIIGLTATPERLDGRGLGEFFDRIIEPTTVRELIERGYLCDYRYYAPHVPDLDGIKKVGGDFSKKGIQGIMNRPTIVGDLVTHYIRLLSGKKVMVFASGIRHSMRIVDAFIAEGIAAAHLDGKTPTAKRIETMARLRSGEIKVVSNVGLFGEGVDVPDLDGVIVARPTASLTWHRQAIGRSLRVADGKPHAIILDHSGNYLRHGMPDDIIDWRLEDKPTKKGEPSKHKNCPVCFAVLPVAQRQCTECGHIFAPQPRKGPEYTDGDLEEVKAKRWTKEEKRALYASLLETARIKGNRVGWCKHKYKAKTKVWPRGMKDLERAAFDACQHIRVDSTTDRCRFCEIFCGKDWS